MRWQKPVCNTTTWPLEIYSHDSTYMGPIDFEQFLFGGLTI